MSSLDPPPRALWTREKERLTVMVLGETPSLVCRYCTFPGAGRLQWASFDVERKILKARKKLYSFASRQGLGVSITCRHTIGIMKEAVTGTEEINWNQEAVIDRKTMCAFHRSTANHWTMRPTEVGRREGLALRKALQLFNLTARSDVLSRVAIA
jgi:hypothetical protein